MIHILKNVKTATFLGGAVVGAVALPVLKSKVVREVAVSALSKGISVKNMAEAQWATMREEAEDLCAEAAFKAESKANTNKKPCDTVEFSETSENSQEEQPANEKSILDTDLDDINEIWEF